MSETTKFENVGVAYLSQSGKAVNLSMLGKVYIIPLSSLKKVMSGGSATVSISLPMPK